VKLRHLAVVVAGLALGAGSLAIARSAPGGSLAGASTASAVALLGVGWALIACGVVAWARRPTSRFGPILAAAGGAWFVVELNNPGIGSPILFTFGLLVYAACPALVAHAALAYPGGGAGGGLERVGLAIAYASTLVVLGLVPALAFDPAAQACAACPRNLVSVTSAPGLVEALNRAGLVAGLVWAPVLAGLALLRIVRSSSAARLLTAPVLLPLVAYLALVGGG
jgi:hypothetical protein